VGKSDYLYRICDAMLLQDYKVLLCSFEFGSERLSSIADSKENGGKDKLRKSRLANKFNNLYINYAARDADSLELMIELAHENGVKCVLIDSFGEIERMGKQEYALQQEIAMMLNRMVNDKQMFICMITQVKTGETIGDYTVRGGEDLIYKPDLSIHVGKLSKEDTSGDRIVHLFKNREADINGKTIVTSYDFENREPKFKCIFQGLTEDRKPIRKLFGQ